MFIYTFIALLKNTKPDSEYHFSSLAPDGACAQTVLDGAELCETNLLFKSIYVAEIQKFKLNLTQNSGTVGFAGFQFALHFSKVRLMCNIEIYTSTPAQTEFRRIYEINPRTV